MSVTAESIREAIKMVREGFDTAVIVLQVVGKSMPQWFVDAFGKVLAVLDAKAELAAGLIDRFAKWLSYLTNFGSDGGPCDLPAELEGLEIECNAIRSALAAG